MAEWVALLRGVNVGGVTIRNAELAEVFTGLGHTHVRTFLASGNVRFDSEDTVAARDDVKSSIEAALRTRFGYDAWIVLVTVSEVRRAMDAFPFDPADGARQPWVIFGSDQAVLDELCEAAASFDDDVDPLRAVSGVLFWNPVKGTTVDTPFGRLLSQKKYRSSTTNRNLRTLAKIVA